MVTAQNGRGRPIRSATQYASIAAAKARTEKIVGAASRRFMAHLDSAKVVLAGYASGTEISHLAMSSCLLLTVARSVVFSPS